MARHRRRLTPRRLPSSASAATKAALGQSRGSASDGHGPGVAAPHGDVARLHPAAQMEHRRDRHYAPHPGGLAALADSAAGPRLVRTWTIPSSTDMALAPPGDGGGRRLRYFAACFIRDGL